LLDLPLLVDEAIDVRLGGLLAIQITEQLDLLRLTLQRISSNSSQRLLSDSARIELIAAIDEILSKLHHSRRPTSSRFILDSPTPRIIFPSHHINSSSWQR
jgi:hypothetical protein